MIKPMVGITAGILTQIEAGYQTVGIDIVITPIMHFLLKKMPVSFMNVLHEAVKIIDLIKSPPLR